MNNSCFDPAYILQPLWDYIRGQEELLLSPYMPAVYAFLTHIILCTPFLLLDVLACIHQRIRSYRISRGSERSSLCRWLYCFCRILFNYITTILPATVAFQNLRSPSLPKLAPSCWQLCIEVLASFLLFDTLFFGWHFSMHRVPWLYKNIHQAHHLNHIPFALAAQDASPAELISLLLLALSSARVVGCHPLSEAIFHFLNSWLAVEDHCGYDLPWGLHRLLPGMGGAPHHQSHHTLQRGNYAPYFTHWDHLCGTYIY